MENEIIKEVNGVRVRKVLGRIVLGPLTEEGIFFLTDLVGPTKDSNDNLRWVREFAGATEDEYPKAEVKRLMPVVNVTNEEQVYLVEFSK